MQATAIPAHVPADRVIDVDIYNLPGADQDAQLAWRNLRDRADLIWTPRHGGHWIAVGADVVESIYRRPEIFSSRESSVPPGSTLIAMMPLQADGAMHTAARRIFDPWFRPSALEPFRRQAQALAVELIEGLRPKGRCEFVSEFGEILPLVIFLSMVDLPVAHREALHEHVEVMTRQEDIARRQAAFQAIIDYLDGWLDKRRRQPGDDVLSKVVHGDLDGVAVTDEQALGMGALLLLGGLDTVASMMGFIMRFLATHPDHRRWIRDNPSDIAKVVEELMRRHGVATNLRTATRDIELDGVTLRAGDFISTPTAVHGLDERRFPDPEDVDFERPARQTLVFGAGPHRCPGMNLARLELRILIEEWLARIPDFELDPDIPMVQKTGGVNGVLKLGLKWDPA